MDCNLIILVWFLFFPYFVAPSNSLKEINKEKILPNIVFILTDDQDQALGGMTPMSKVKTLLQNEGTSFLNSFTPTPLCCPSRSTILTGRYSHNHNTVNNSVSGNCSSKFWVNGPEKKTFAVSVQQSGYKTYFAGKYLNQYGKGNAGANHIPPGWDEWFALIGNSKYYNYSVSDNGKIVHHGDNYAADYFTDLLANRSVEFIQQQKDADKPFLMMVSTPAPHSPWNNAPQYAKRYNTSTAPRHGSWNHNGQDKHWLLRQATNPMAKESISYLDNAFRKRWQTLLSVDDLVGGIVQTLEKAGKLDNTYIIYTSDNGYHLGQFSLPIDKRQLYEFDIRIPLVIRGPGVSKNVTRNEAVVNIDIAPTIVDIATGSQGHIPDYMDGTSLTPLFDAKKKPKWRTDFLVEYEGEGKEHPPPGCPKVTAGESQCFPSCVCEDAFNNTYSCVRTLNPSKKEDWMYCEFTDSETFVEVYNHTTDPHQLTNIKKTVNPQFLVEMNQRLIELGVCVGKSCRAPSSVTWPSHDFVDVTWHKSLKRFSDKVSDNIFDAWNPLYNDQL